MKILLVEDDAPKRDSILRFLSRVFPELSIDIASSVNSAARMIDDNEFDCIILDMSLPNFDGDKDLTGGRPINYGGEDLIDYIDKLEKSTKVIFISQYARFKEEGDEKNIVQLAKELSEEYPYYYVNMIYYHSAHDSWQQSLASAMKEVIDGRS